MSNYITIKDIANALNLSTSTVSRALSDKYDVNKDTRKLILETAKKMGYKPNMLSVALRGGKSYSIGVIIPEITTSFFSGILNGINDVLIANNYNSLITISNESHETEKRNIEFLEAKQVDGFLISVAKDTCNSDIFDKVMMEEGIPIVFFNRLCNDTDAPQVVIDEEKWAFKVTEHLIQQGCRRIIHLAGPSNLSLSKDRKNGYLKALTAYGIPIDDTYIIPCDIHTESGAKAVPQIMSLNPIPDGIFAFTDPVAIGAMLLLIKNGIKVPEEMKIAGYSDSTISSIIEPNLTSIKQPTYEMGSTAAKILLSMINNPGRLAPRKTVLDATLNIRASSMK